jgi:hypothetical protein
VSARARARSRVAALLLAIAFAVVPAVAQGKAKKHRGGHPGEHRAQHGTEHGRSKRIAITSGDGGGAPEAPVRAQLTKVLKKSKIKVVSRKKGEAPSDDQQWVALGQKLKVDGFIQLSFEAGHGKRSVEITVRTGADGSVLGNETFTAKGPPAKLGAVVAKNFWKKLGARVKQTSAANASDSVGMPARDLAREEPATPSEKSPLAEPETPTPAEPTPAVPEKPDSVTAVADQGRSNNGKSHEDTSDDGKSDEEAAGTTRQAPKSKPSPGGDDGNLGPREPMLTAVVQARYLHRSFVYTPGNAAPAASVTAPTFGAELAWFPLANFGVAVGGEAENWIKEAGKYPTLSSDLHGSLVFRMALSFGELYLRAGAFRHFFAISDDSNHSRLDLSVPDVVYVGARAGGALAVPLTPALSLTVSADYRLVTSLDGGGYPLKSPSYFPRATPGPAFDGAVTLAYRITELLELQAGGDVRRYVMALGGRPGDRINASGATDLYLAGWVGVGGVYGGH